MKMQMTKVTTIKELQRLAEEIKGESFHWQRLRKLIPYELMPVIENCPSANAEFTHRAHYYERLKTDAPYRAVYERMLAAMKQIYFHIERKKLSSSNFYFLPKEQIAPTKKPLMDKEGYPIRDPDSVPIEIFCAALPHRERWCDLGEGVGQSIAEDSIFCRWRGTLQQFDSVAIFLQRVLHQQALKPSGIEFIAEIKACLRELNDVLQKPWERDHIRAFETVAAYVRRHAGEDETIVPTIRKDMEMDFTQAQKSVPVVCRDLITFLEGLEEKSVQENPTTPADKPNKEAQEWFRCGDFDVCHTPLALRIGEKEWSYSKPSSEKNAVASLKKIIRIIALFAPTPAEKYTHGFSNYKKLTADLRKRFASNRPQLSDLSVASQLSAARKFLMEQGSRYTISNLDDSGQLSIVIR